MSTEPAPAQGAKPKDKVYIHKESGTKYYVNFIGDTIVVASIDGDQTHYSVFSPDRDGLKMDYKFCDNAGCQILCESETFTYNIHEYHEIVAMVALGKQSNVFVEDIT